MSIPPGTRHSQPNRPFSVALEAIDRIPHFCDSESSVREVLIDEQIGCMNYSCEFGMDRLNITDWK